MATTANVVIALLAAGCGQVESVANEGGVPHAGAVAQDVNDHICPAGETVQGIDVSTFQGKVPGITGDVDGDVFNGSLSALQALAGGGDGGGDGEPPPPPDDACAVHSDHRLYCHNTAGAAIYAAPTTASAVVNHLRTTFSWFDCWGTGALHAGGNTTWYHTLGDDNASWGWVPAVDLQTTSAFDADPTAGGLQRCP